ncbi:MAG: hypothetical protein H7263_10990, partial [Candidatus Sericytochromatia bacterium]|nr:hypothetical protein [Candidatus Sericytochromatia bacterium]
ALGAYIIGLTKSFESDISSKKDAAIILDENELMINISGKNKLKTMFLKTFAAQISDNIYKVDYSSFLNECNNPEDIKKKITLFKQEVSEDYPRIWDNFFKEIVKKSVALEKSEGMIVYKLRKDQELIDLILKDEVLKKNILKVENFQIAIDKKDLSRVRKRLEEFGYVGIID